MKCIFEICVNEKIKKKTSKLIIKLIFLLNIIFLHTDFFYFMKKICVFLYFLCKNHIYSNFENNKVNIYIYILLLTLCDQGSNQWNKCESPLLDRTTNSIASHDPQQHQHIHWLRANKDHQSSCPRTIYLSHHGLILERVAVH